MTSKKILALALTLTVTFSLSIYAAQKEKATKEPAKPSYDLPQPEKETLDYAMYGSIRTEALNHSHVME